MTGELLVVRFALQDCRSVTAVIQVGDPRRDFATAVAVKMAQKHASRRSQSHGTRFFAFCGFPSSGMSARSPTARYGPWRLFLGVFRASSLLHLHFCAHLMGARPRHLTRQPYTSRSCTRSTVRTSRKRAQGRSVLRQLQIWKPLLQACLQTRRRREQKHERRRSPDGTPRRPRSDSFQLKLRNYYSRKARLEGSSAENGEEKRHLEDCWRRRPRRPPRRRTTRDYDDEKPSRRRSWRTTDVSEASKLRALERRLGAAEDALDRETRLRQKAEVALEVARAVKGRRRS